MFSALECRVESNRNRKMKRRMNTPLNSMVVGTGLLLMAFQACAAERETSMILSCKEDNDLYRT